MKGDKAVIKVLNKALVEEITAVLQYFLHAEMCENRADSLRIHGGPAEDNMEILAGIVERICRRDSNRVHSRYTVEIGNIRNARGRLRRVSAFVHAYRPAGIRHRGTTRVSSLSLIHISAPTIRRGISYAGFCV